MPPKKRRRKRTITCTNCGVSISLTGRAIVKRGRRGGPKAQENIDRGKLLSQFQKFNRLNRADGKGGPFTRQQKARLAALPRAPKKRGTKRATTRTRATAERKRRVLPEDVPLPGEEAIILPARRLTREEVGRQLS